MQRNPIPIGTIDFVEGGRQFLDINRSGVLLETSIRLRFTITNGSSAAVGPLWHALAALMKRIEFIVNGRDTVISIDGPGAVARATYEYGNLPYGMSDTVVLTGSATATSYDVIIPIPHFLPRSIQPLNTALPVNALGQTSIAITWGTINDFYTTPNGAAISNVTCEVLGKYLTDGNPQAVYNARILDTREIDLASTSDKFQFEVDVGSGLLYRNIMLATLVDGLPSDAILAAGKIALLTGQHTFQNWDGAPFVQAENKHRFNQDSHATGIYFLDTEIHGAPMPIDTSRAVMPASLLLLLDAAKQAGTNTIRQYRESVRAFRTA